MVSFCGYSFSKVNIGTSIKSEAVVVIKNRYNELGAVYTIRFNSRSVCLRSFKRKLENLKDPVKDINDYDFFVCLPHSFNGKSPSAISEEIRKEFAMNKTYLSTAKIVRKDQTVDPEQIGFYLYVLINEDTGALYFDYDFQEKKFINPMNKKAPTYNGFVMRGEVHPNRTMHYYAVNNFPIKPEKWFAVKLGGVIVGRSNITNKVSRISAEYIKKGALVLNRVFGNDAHCYRNSYSGKANISFENYLSIVKPETFDMLENLMNMEKA